MKKTEPKEEVAITFGEVIHFQQRDKEYGAAEFVICPVFKYGVMRECYIYPKQQPQYFKKYFKVDLRGIKINQLGLSGHPALEADPSVWMAFWCKEHKCFSLEMYAGKGTSELHIDTHFGNLIDFSFE